MSERVLPTPDVYATCPTDGRIMAYYDGFFESVFVLLHPFLRPRSIRIEQFKPDTYPIRATIERDCEAIPWSRMASLARLPSVEAVDIGLRTLILGLATEFQRSDYASALDAALVEHGLVPPPEGVFSDLLYRRVLDFVQSLGYQWFWVGDEFGTERKLRWIDDLKSEETPRSNLFTPDHKLLWTTHWDSHFSFFCAPRDQLARLSETINPEGFICGRETDVYWSLQAHRHEV